MPQLRGSSKVHGGREGCYDPEVSGGMLMLFFLAVVVRVGFFVARGRGGPPPPKHALPPPDDPRWRGRAEDQIAGRPCGHCKAKIVTDAEGRTCKHCGTLLHRRACAKEHRVHAHAAGEAPYR